MRIKNDLVMNENFSQYAEYYDVLNGTKDYRGESEEIKRLIDIHHPQAESILEYGAGTGKHGLEFVKQGYHYDGTELSETMLRIAKNKDLAIEYGDIRTYRAAKSFDVAIALFHVFSYLTTNEDILSSLKSIGDNLKGGGLFIFDTWYGPAVLSEGVETRVRRAQNDVMDVIRIAESELDVNSSVAKVTFDIHLRNKTTSQSESFKEHHYMRYFFIQEIKMFAESAGFELISYGTTHGHKMLDSSTWSSLFILKKIGI